MSWRNWRPTRKFFAASRAMRSGDRQPTVGGGPLRSGTAPSGFSTQTAWVHWTGFWALPTSELLLPRAGLPSAVDAPLVPIPRSKMVRAVRRAAGGRSGALGLGARHRSGGGCRSLSVAPLRSAVATAFSRRFCRESGMEVSAGAAAAVAVIP